MTISVLVAWAATGSDRSTEEWRSTTDPETVYLRLGFDGRLDCPYTANPPVTLIVWSKNGSVIQPDPDSKIEVSKAGSLLIPAAEVGDEGEYACAVYSPSGPTESSPIIQLRVRGKHILVFLLYTVYTQRVYMF